MRFICLYIVCSLATNIVLAQNLTVEWGSFFQGDFKTLDVHAGFVIDSNNNIYTATSWADQKTYIIKYDENGRQQWLTEYTNGIFVEARKIAIDNNDNIYVSGIEEDTTGTFNMLLLKLDISGNLLWSRTYGNPMVQEEVNEMVIDSDNNVILVGEGNAEGQVFSSAVIVKYDTNGNLLWSDFRSITNTSTEAFFVKTNASNDVIILWDANGISQLTKLNTLGVHQWTVQPSNFNVSQNSKNAILINTKNEIYLGGNRFFSGTYTDVVLHKYDTNGNVLWNQTFASSGSIHDSFETFQLDNLQNLIVLTDIGSNYALIKYNDLGVLQWDFSSSSTSNLEPENIIINNQGEIYASVSDGTKGSIRKHQNSDGLELFNQSYTNSNYLRTEIKYLWLDTNNKLVGSNLMRLVSNNYFHSAIIKFIDNTSIVDDYKIHSEHLILYPNPTSNFLTIKTKINTPVVKVTITDLSGKTFFTTKLSNNTVDISSLSNGIYCISFFQGNELKSLKFVKI